MRLTEKENETLPIDVSDRHPHVVYRNLRLPLTTSTSELPAVFTTILFFLSTDCITDPTILCDDLLWDCPHCWRVQRHGRLLRAEKQVGWVTPQHLPPLMMWLFVCLPQGKHAHHRFLISNYYQSVPTDTLNPPHKLLCYCGTGVSWRADPALHHTT